MDDFFGHLKSSTRSLHDAVERSSLLDRLARGDIDRAQYSLLLATLYGIYSPLEFAVHAILERTPVETKVAWFKMDFQALSVNESELLLCTQLPVLETRASAMGALYVLEGSTLGGRILSQRVRSVLGIGPSNGGRFFYGYGDDTGRRWSQFKDELLQEENSPGARKKIVEAAKATFRAIARWMGERCEHQLK